MQFHHRPIVTVGLVAALSFGSVVAPALAVDGGGATGSAGVSGEAMQEEPCAVWEPCDTVWFPFGSRSSRA